MKAIVKIVNEAGAMDPYDPKKITDLGSVMIGIF